MAVIKRAGSGKSYHFVDDAGRVYAGSIEMAIKLFTKKEFTPKDFIVLSRMPNGVSPTRFPRSKVWNPEKQCMEDYDESKISTGEEQLKTSDDAYGSKTRLDNVKVKIEKKLYTDKVVQW